MPCARASMRCVRSATATPCERSRAFTRRTIRAAAGGFRASGTLARDRDTSSGTVNRDDEARYLDEAGRIVATSSRLSPLAPQPGASVSPDVRPAVPDLYRTVRALPFWSLIGP